MLCKPLSEVTEIFLQSTPANTERTYRNAIDTLGDMYRFIDFNQNAESLLLKEREIKKDIDKKIYGPESKKLCLGFLQALLKFINCREKGKRNNNLNMTRRKKTKIKPLTQAEFEEFIKQLRQINERDALIADIFWYMNNELLEVGDFITLESILRVTKDDLKYSVIPDCNIIDFWEKNKDVTHLTSISSLFIRRIA